MAVTRTMVGVPPAIVWSVLADAGAYEHWVVGCREVRGVEGEWPEEGSCFHHTFMVGPVPIPDRTDVIECVPGRRLQLNARARPTGHARVGLELRACAGRTEVVMTEEPTDGLARLGDNPLGHALIHLRNRESLRRLRRLAETRGAVTPG